MKNNYATNGNKSAWYEKSNRGYWVHLMNGTQDSKFLVSTVQTATTMIADYLSK